MDDLIFRKAAVKEIARWIGYIDEDMILRIQTGLKKVPSAEPSSSSADAHLVKEGANDGDTISRQAAISEMKKMYDAAEKWLRDANETEIEARAQSCMSTLIEIKLRIEKLPSAQPEEDTIEMQEADIDETMKRLRDARVTILPSAEPVIRCAECIHWDRDGEEDVDGEKLCHFFSEGNEEFEFTVASDDYCSFAERRTDESN